MVVYIIYVLGDFVHRGVFIDRLGVLKGGKARASKLTPEQRKEIAEKAAKAK